MDEPRIAIAEHALGTAAAVIALHRAGHARARIASTLGLTESGVWRIQYAFGLTDNTDESVKRHHNPSWLRVSSAAQSRTQSTPSP